MKRKLLLLTLIFGIAVNSIAQQIPLKGVVTVQNSKTNTGQIQYVRNAEVTHEKAKSEVTDDDGKFTLNITGLKLNSQTQISVTPHGEYSEYVIVNAKELVDITLGRVTPVNVFICKKGDLERRQAEMIGINMRKLEERMEVDKKRLQKELDLLKQNNDYLNARYSAIKDSLDKISKNVDNAFESIKEYAKTMVLENLDLKDDNYVKAYHCFSRGALDSVFYYLQDRELDVKHQKILQLQEEAKREKELAAILIESAKEKEEFSENSLNELIKEWLLLARTADMQNNYEKTIHYYEKVTQADSLNFDNMFEYAQYLYKINEYDKAEKCFLQCLKISRAFSVENQKMHQNQLAKVLNSLALLHKRKNEYTTAIKEFEEALNIYRKLTVENSSIYLENTAVILHNMANLHRDLKEYGDALKKFEEALEIRRELAEKNPQIHLVDVAGTLNDWGNFHYIFNEYEAAVPKYEEALSIRRILAAENPKEYLPLVAATLNNLANVHRTTKVHTAASQEFEEALKIRRNLAVENPKVYLPDVAATLNNLAILHASLNDFSSAVLEYEEALKIRRELADKNPKVYLSEVAQTLHNLGIAHYRKNEFSTALTKFEESSEIRKQLAIETPKKYLPDVATSLSTIGVVLFSQEKYSEALKKLEETLEIYKNLASENPKLYLHNVVTTYADIALFNIYSKKYAEAESYAQQALALENSYYKAKINLAHALLFQHKFLEAKELHLELLETMEKQNQNYLQMMLFDFDAFEKGGAIPESCKADVEKIKVMLKK